MRWQLLFVVVLGCGRLGFEPTDRDAAIQVDGAAGDGSVIDAPDGGPAACMSNPAYITVPSLPNRYRQVSTLLTWAEARANCLADGADLVIPTGGAEAVALDGDWIGLTDAATEGVWLTVHGDTPPFLLWQIGEPDGGTSENCGRNNEDGFEARECTDLRDYVCECVP